MKQICRTLPYRFQLVNAAALDVIDSLSRDAMRDRETGQIVGTVKVFDNESKVAFAVSTLDEGHAKVCISMLSPARNLTDGGQCRALNYLADSMEQLLENTFAQTSKKEKAI